MSCLIAGCGGGDSGETTATKSLAPLRVSGSGSTSGLLEKLAPLYGVDDARAELRFLEGTDSAGGIAAAQAGEIEIGAVSRDPKPGEIEMGTTYRPFARDAAAFVGAGGVDGLTTGQLKRVFSGRVRNWREIGGGDVPLVVLVRDEDESITQLLRAELFGEDFRFSRNAAVLSSAADMNESLERTPGAIGFTSFGSFRSEGKRLSTLAVAGESPSVESIENGRYPYVRRLGVVYRPAEHETAFERFLHSGAVAERLRQLGYAPVA